MRGLRLWFRFLAQNLKIRLEYKADSIILFFSGAVYQTLGFLFLTLLFSRVPQIQGWTQWEIVAMLAVIFMSEGVVSFAFEGVWQLAFLVNQGELDRLLLRPVSPIFQVMTYTVGIHGIGNLILGVLLLGVSLGHVVIPWDAARILYVPVFLVSAWTIRVAISFAANCATFWLRGYSNAFPLMVYQLADFGKYPATLFGKAAEIFFLAVLPYGFMAFVPAVWLFGKADWVWAAWLTPLVAVWCALVARWLFYRGLRRYEGAGN